MPSVALITANLGGIDKNPVPSFTPQSIPTNWSLDIFYFDDKNLPPRSESLSPRLQAKIPKMLAWEMIPEYDYYIWLDSAFSISSPNCVEWLVNNCEGYDIALFNHHKRKSIRSELHYMQKKMRSGDQYLIKRYKNEPMEEQVENYLLDTEFKDNALYIGGAFVYSNNLVSKSNNAMKDWFYHCARYSVQDQLSLPYVLAKHNARINTFSQHLFKNEHLHYLYSHD